VLKYKINLDAKHLKTVHQETYEDALKLDRKKQSALPQ
jgi:hypothetical protein